MKKLKSTCLSQLASADVILALVIPSCIVKFVAEVTVGQATNPLWYIGVLFFIVKGIDIFRCNLVFLCLIQFNTCFYKVKTCAKHC